MSLTQDLLQQLTGYAEAQAAEPDHTTDRAEVFARWVSDRLQPQIGNNNQENNQ